MNELRTAFECVVLRYGLFSVADAFLIGVWPRNQPSHSSTYICPTKEMSMRIEYLSLQHACAEGSVSQGFE